ncbi:MAG: DHH family phosphoesterase, partial [Selenomonadaceae bacterium]|nr:DHH family phosphoesterase [Selenomonadaceae bacterium]
MRKKWVIREADVSSVQTIAEALGVSELTAKVLYHRGIRDAQAAKNFLEPEAAPFNDPFAMKGMRTAVDRIIQALNAHEKICIYGDYDVDGMSASAILIRTLRKFGAEVESYIPARSEGYGLNIPALKKISSEGAKLLISVDCGITNEKEIAAVKDSLDVIVTDHHLPALEDIKSAVAVVNPNQRGCPYPEKNLCGAGVAFKLSQALNFKLRGVDVQTYTKDIDIAAMATVADIVPLIGENRKIVRMGLLEMSRTRCTGLRALISAAGLGGKKISAGQVAFQ